MEEKLFPCSVKGCRNLATNHSWFTREGKVFRVCKEHLRGIDDFCEFFFGGKPPSVMCGNIVVQRAKLEEVKI